MFYVKSGISYYKYHYKNNDRKDSRTCFVLNFNIICSLTAYYVKVLGIDI